MIDIVNTKGGTNVQCDECFSNFDIKDTNFIRNYGDIEEVGFICPNCSTEYIAYRTNSYIRQLQTKVQKERQKLVDHISNCMEPDEADKRLKKLLSFHQKEMAIFNNRA